MSFFTGGFHIPSLAQRTPQVFLLLFLLSSLLFTPIFLSIITESALCFWIVLLACTALSLIYSSDGFGTWDYLTVFFFDLYVTSWIFFIIFTLIVFPYLNQPILFSRHLYFIGNTHIIFLLPLPLMLAIFLRAVKKTLQEKPPKLKEIPDLKIEGISNQSSDLLKAFLQPLEITGNLVLAITVITVNILWKLIGTASCLFFRFLSFFSNELFNKLMFDSNIWKPILRTMCSLILVVIVFKCYLNITPMLHKHLNTSFPIGSISLEAIIFQLWGAGIFILSFLVLNGLNLIWRDLQCDSFLEQSIFAGAMIILSLFLSNGILCFISFFNILGLSGFDSIGIFFLFILICGVAVISYKLLWSQNARIRIEK